LQTTTDTSSNPTSSNPTADTSSDTTPIYMQNHPNICWMLAGGAWTRALPVARLLQEERMHSTHPAANPPANLRLRCHSNLKEVRGKTARKGCVPDFGSVQGQSDVRSNPTSSNPTADPPANTRPADPPTAHLCVQSEPNIHWVRQGFPWTRTLPNACFLQQGLPQVTGSCRETSYKI
jgi:hypothetical protein